MWRPDIVTDWWNMVVHGCCGKISEEELEYNENGSAEWEVDSASSFYKLIWKHGDFISVLKNCLED